MSQDTYRKHAKPRSFESARGEIVRRILDVIGKTGLTANGIKRRTKIDFAREDLYRLREGDMSCLSDNRLLLLAERLGVKVLITVH